MRQDETARGSAQIAEAVKAQRCRQIGRRRRIETGTAGLDNRHRPIGRFQHQFDQPVIDQTPQAEKDFRVTRRVATDKQVLLAGTLGEPF